MRRGTIAALLLVGCAAAAAKTAPEAPTPAAAPPSAKPAPPRDGCAFVKSGCWRALVGSVHECLGTDGDAGAVVKGTLNEAATTCTYAKGRQVVFARPILTQTKGPPQEAIGDLDFTVTADGKTCLHYVETQNEITVTSALGRYNQVNSAGGPSITCMDGAKYELNGTELFQGCAEYVNDGLPIGLSSPRAFSFGKEGWSAMVSLQLGGLKAPLYSCLWKGHGTRGRR